VSAIRTPTLDAALSFAARGWAVLPVRAESTGNEVSQ